MSESARTGRDGLLRIRCLRCSGDPSACPFLAGYPEPCPISRSRHRASRSSGWCPDRRAEESTAFRERDRSHTIHQRGREVPGWAHVKSALRWSRRVGSDPSGSVLRRVRAIIAAFAVLGCQACNTAFHAHLPRALGDAASSEETIAHCLASLGFNDRSHESLNVESIRKEPELIAVWLTPHGSAWSSSSQTVATIRKHPGRWSVTFISRSSSVSAQALSTSFLNCVPTRAPAIEVEVDSTWFLDLR